MQFARLNDVTLHYQLIGSPQSRRLLMFVNSLGTVFRIWRDVVTGLAGDVAFLLDDTRGHGHSEIGATPRSIDMRAAACCHLCWRSHRQHGLPHRQALLDDAAASALDPVLNHIEQTSRGATLLAHRRVGSAICDVEIRLQGSDETVFFDIWRIMVSPLAPQAPLPDTLLGDTEIAALLGSEAEIAQMLVTTGASLRTALALLESVTRIGEA